MARKSTAVAGAQDNAVVQAGDDAQLPAYMRQDSARGSENVTTDDLIIPRLEIAQALSPCVDEGDPAYIEGCKPGMLFNSVTRKLYGDSVIFVPVLFMNQYLCWRDRDKGGGFAGAHDTIEQARAAIAEQPDPQEWEPQQTGQHFGLIVLNANGDTEEIVISMAKTKLKVSRNFNSLIRINGGDRFSRAYVVAGVEEKNNKGEKYKNFSIKNFGFPSEPIYLAAERMYESVTSGDRVIEADTTFTEEVSPEEPEF